MQLSSSESFEQTSDDKEFSGTRSRKKHKRLDAICEKAYTRSHSRVAFEVGLKKAEVLEDNGEENDTEVRRSSRVRRAPVLLDASPAPPRKRRRVDNKDAFSSMDKGKRVVRVKAESQFPSKGNVDADFTGWRTRLRSRGSCVGFNRRENGGSSMNSRTKLFRNSKGVKEEWGFESEETEDGIEELAQGDLTVGKSKRCKALLENEDKDNDSDGNTEDDKEVLEEISISRSEENLLVSETKDGLFNGIGSKDVLEPSSSSEHCHQNDIPEFVEDNCQLEKCNPGKNQTNDNLDGKENLNVVSGSLTEDIYRAEAETENVDDMLKKHSPQTGKDQINAVDLDISVEDVSLAKNGVKPIEDGIPESFEKITVGLDAKVRSGHMKEGRHCGLCGGGSNGKPPKKLIQDVNGCDKEESSGGSTSEEPGYDVWDGFGDEPGWLGRLLGPINDRYGIAGIWVHQQCAVWSPEVYFSSLGCLKNVRAALWRGRVLKCSRCGKPGATIGCRVDRCPRTYHLPCARATGSLFDHRKFLIACNDHRHHFQPHGIHYLRRLKKLKERKVKFDLRKVSNEALRKDIEAEEKLLENCGEDEEFVKRESKRLQRDLLRIAPTYIGGGNCDSGAQYQGWESIAGLHDVIQCMKEVVFLPLLYPEFFSNLGITPPRGVLLHGYPGTGKTLVVRALIGSCARGDKRIAYFARKGADCLGKYVGDAERQLRLLFQVAEKSQPSIIFFDEIDGLAPCRTRHQDQTHSSVVSTLLALMDGLKSRGSVVVIGATNRPDAVDPALRRPGRFDREIYFPLPSANDREAILSLHTKKWPKPISGSLLRLVARKTVGFAGADLQALCTQAAMIALRRSFPLKELLSSAGERVLSSKPPLLTSFTVEEKDWLDALSHSPPPCSRRDVGIAVNDVVSSPLASHLVPFMLRPLSELLVSLYLDERVWLPTSLSKSAIVIRNAIVSALSKKGGKYDSWWLNLHDLLQKPETLHDIEDNLRHETILTEDGVCNSDSVLDVGDDAYLKCKPSKLQRIGAYHGLPNESGRKSGFRILIAGKPSSGQRHLASCLLHCFSGNVEMRKIDLATMSQEGQGDAVQGLTQILTRCSGLSPCVVFLPRIDLWAVETCYQTNEGQDGSPSNGKKSGELEGSSETQNAFTTSSNLWSSFMEQVESIGISTSVMILATSEMLFEDLPTRISQFFKCETSKSGISTSLKAAVPRFVVHLDGNMCNDMVLDISATKVSNNLAQYYIELINKGAHESSSPVGDISDAAAVIKNIDAVPRSSNSVSDMKTVVDTSSAALRHSVKGKSNLMLAISTFGYQILCYPHFAELCWVTSKLKEGPCTDINGPWKRWPFNSCIARPVNSADERITGACSSKDKEKSYVVRGLVAIGFLAYKGEYTSLKEVSLQVRKVLELLVARINSKIQAGKNKLKFFHVLSHVASFDDLVTSWSYALRSLEVDDPLLDENTRLPCQRSPSSHVVGGIHEDNQCKENISHETLHETEALKDDPLGIQSNEIRTRALVVDLDLNVPINDIEGESAVDISSNPNVTNHVASDVHVNSHLHKGSSRAETCAPLATENPSEDSAVLLEGGPFNTGHKIDSVIRGQHNEGSRFPSTANEIASELGSEKCSDGIAKTSACPPEDCGLVSVYHCCSQCLVNLRKVILTLVKTEITEDNVTIEGFHDVVAASSAKLQSEVRKLVFTDAETKKSKYSYEEGCKCLLRSWKEGRVMPMECDCHLSTGNRRAEPNSLELTVSFKDGVMKHLEDAADANARFGTKFMSLCLCSLVNWLVMSKVPPLD